LEQDLLNEQTIKPTNAGFIVLTGSLKVVLRRSRVEFEMGKGLGDEH
jgi:hypothetical protein